MTVPSVETILIAGRAAFLVFSFSVATVTFARWRRATVLQTERILAHQDTVLRRLGELETRLEATSEAVTQLAERPRQAAATGGSGSPGYQIAIRLARSGASREELMCGCGLSQHEAELVWRLHAPQNGARRLKSA